MLALTLALAGCTQIALICLALFPPKAPTASGTWRGKLIPLEVIDEEGEIHTVKAVILVEALDIKVDVPQGWPDTVYQSYSDSDDPSRAYLLVEDGAGLIPYNDTPIYEDNVIFTGRIGYGDNPKIGDRRAIRLSNSAVVVKSDGTEYRMYTSGSERLAIGTITPAE